MSINNQEGTDNDIRERVKNYSLSANVGENVYLKLYKPGGSAGNILKTQNLSLQVNKSRRGDARM